MAKPVTWTRHDRRLDRKAKKAQAKQDSGKTKKTGRRSK
jgi:hypothetical protein